MITQVPDAHIRGKLYRGARPHPSEILSLRINTVVTLQSGIYDLFHDDDFEELDWEEEGIVHFDRGLSDFSQPEVKDVIKIVKLMKQNLDVGLSVLVHCLAGKDRTGYIVAAYRMLVNGWAYKQAKKELKSMGMHWWYFWWTPGLRKFQGKRLEDFT